MFVSKVKVPVFSNRPTATVTNSKLIVNQLSSNIHCAATEMLARVIERMIRLYSNEIRIDGIQSDCKI